MKKLSFKLVFLFSFLLLILLHTQLLYIDEARGLGSNNSTKLNSDHNPEPIEVKETYSLYLLILGIITVIAVFLVLFIEPKVQRKEALARAGRTLKLALNENRKDLLNVEGKYQEVDRKITKEISEEREREIRYVNVYLDYDSYESVLHTGFFTHFCPKTQKTLSTLHHELRYNNELISYIDHYTDLHRILHFNNDSMNSDIYYHKRKAEYEAHIMELQKEILNHIDTLAILIDEELKHNSIF